MFWGVIMALSNESKYILETGKRACDRLEVQARMIQPLTQEYLVKAGLKEGLTVCDIGCGNGVITEYLARQVGPAGKVYAIDISAEQIEVARKRIDGAGFKNVEFIKLDITSAHKVEALGWKADIVLMRLVLMHLKKPSDAIENIKHILSPSGKVVSWESTFSESLNDEDLDPKIKKFIEKILAYGSQNDFDFSIGARLDDLYNAAGYAVKEYNQIKVKFPEEVVRDHHLMMFDELKGTLEDAGLLGADEIASIGEAYKTLPIANIGMLEPQGAVVLAGLGASAEASV